MKAMTRTTIVLATAVLGLAGLMPAAHADDTVTINGVTYQDRGAVTLDDASSSTGSVSDPIGGLVGRVLVGAGTCVPSSFTITIGDRTVHTYYSATDTWYHWQVPVDAVENGCSHNLMTLRGQLFDQTLDGSSPPTQGQPATATGYGYVSIVVELWVDYQAESMAGLDYHTLTLVANAMDNRSGKAACATKSWTYLPTPVGPADAGSTPQMSCP